MAIAPNLITDTFSRSVSDSWSVSDSGHTWLGEISVHDTDGSHGKITVGSSTSYRTIYIDEADQGEGELLVKLKWESTTSVPSTDFGPVLRRTSSTTFYALTLQGSTSQVAVIVYVNGQRHELGRNSVTIAKNLYYWVRFKFDDSKLYGKVWQEGLAEPSSWTITANAYTGSGAPGAGDFGMFHKGTANNYDVLVDTFYAYTNDPDEYQPMPVTDTFARVVHRGWGISPSGHVWEGAVSDDPSEWAPPWPGSINGTNALITIPSASTKYTSFIGPSTSDDIEVLTEFSCNNSGESQFIHVGLYGTMTQTSGDSHGHGYFISAVMGGTTITLYEKNTFNGTENLLAASAALGFTLSVTTHYWIRFQMVGTTMKARIWEDGTTEPITWNITHTDATITSGRAWLEFGQIGATSSVFSLYEFSYDTPAPPATNHTTIGAFSTSGTNDTQTTIRLAFTNDVNDNNSATCHYRKVGTSQWLGAGSATRNDVSSRFENVFTGLTPGTSYQFRFTVSDPDTVVGTNPISHTHTTTTNGLETVGIDVLSVGTTTADIRTYYLRDSDNDSTCTLERRALSSRTNYFMDTFSGQNETLLQTHLPEVGTGWTKHPNGSADAKLYSNRLYVASTTANQKCIYYINDNTSNNYYEVEGDIYIGGLSTTGHAGVCARMVTAAETYYVAMYDMGDRAWELQRFVSGTASVLGQVFFDAVVGVTYKIKLIVNDDYKQMYVDDELIIQSTDNTVSAAGRAGIHYRGMSGIATAQNSMVLDNFSATHLTTTSSWTSLGAMTPDRVNKRFNMTPSSLALDTVYEFRATFADADGLTGFNPFTTTATTRGQVAQLSSIGTSTTQTAATVDVLYLLDSNNNSSLSVQYKSTREMLWTTLDSESISVDRGAKKFTAIISGLKPSTTYEVKVTISDPNGILEGTSASLTSLFTTTIPIIADATEKKHYLWKIYEPDGDYITTWHDAGEPEFSWYENGGVTDLRTRLPRRVSEINNPKSGIGQQNRVDVYCIDPSSNGFGPNLVEDSEFSLGMWVLGANASISSTGGPDGTSALKIEDLSDPIVELTTTSAPISTPRPGPMVARALVKSSGARASMYIEAYDMNDINIDQSTNVANSVGTEWQQLHLEYTPPPKTSYVRIVFINKGKTTIYVDKVTLRLKENLIYRGRIESYTPTIEQEEEYIDVEILGLVSQLSDDYIHFLQFVTIQPAKDTMAGRTNYGAMDPAEMLKMVIDIANNQNSRFDLYYTDTSIRATGTFMEYTFRDQQIRACFDKIRTLCPAGWHYYVEPDGLVVLRGSEHATTYRLRVGVEILNFSVEKSIRNLKNYVRIKGRQDEDNSEADGHGSIEYVTFDQESISRYGKRMVIIRDSNITDPDTAELVGDGRLEEFNREEQRALCNIPDDKSVVYTSSALRGDNIEQYRPGDNILIYDPIAGPQNTYWDYIIWDESNWDFTNEFAPLPESVPIKKIQFHGTYALLELSERQPSQQSDYGRLHRWLQLNDADKGEES